MSGRGGWKLYFVVGLTLVRIPLVLVFLTVTILAPKPLDPLWFTIAFASMILSAVSDLLDGWFARRFDVVTRFGEHADPLVDKIFYLTTFPTLVYLAGLSGQYLHAQLLLGMTIFFLMRDQWVSFLRSIGAIHGVSAGANWSGKVRTIISFPTICTIYYYLQVPPSWWLQVPAWVVYALEIAGIIINLISIWVYTVNYWPYLRKEMKPGGPKIAPSGKPTQRDVANEPRL